jgi:hypothetical protein
VAFLLTCSSEKAGSSATPGQRGQTLDSSLSLIESLLSLNQWQNEPSVSDEKRDQFMIRFTGFLQR